MKWEKKFFGFIIALVMLIGSSVYAEDNEQYIVYLKAPAMPTAVTNAPAEASADGLMEDLTEEQAVGALSGASGDSAEMPEIQSGNRDYIVVSEEELREYLDADMVAFYEPDAEVTLFDDINGESSGAQWNLANVKVAKAWNLGCYGNDVRVGVIDSGVYAHEDLQKNLLSGHNYINEETPDDTTDTYGHGTFVAGLIAAEANGNYIDGIANRAKIVPLKCFDNKSSANISDIADAIYDAVNVYHCDVINMSFGTPDKPSTTLQNSIEYAQSKGCIPVAAVGNDGNSSIYYPANYDGVIGVGAVDANNQICSFSQKNKTVDVVAPGSGLKSVSIPSFTGHAGTSFSAPQVSAMAAIAKCINPDITSGEFQTLLQETSMDLGSEGYDTSYGYGLVNIESMVDKMLENTSCFLSPVAEDENAVSVTVYNNSTEALAVTEMTGVYRGNQFVRVSLADGTIPAGSTRIYQSVKDEIIKFMLLDGSGNWHPLAANRTYVRDGVT